MGLTLPNLDDRTYADPPDEARALGPAYAPGRAGHNPADPGITLVVARRAAARSRAWA